MDLDQNQSNRINRLVAGVMQRRSSGPETRAITPATGRDRAMPWRFTDACNVISALGEHYGLDQAKIWSHVIEGADMDDVDLGWLPPDGCAWVMPDNDCVCGRRRD